MRTLKRAGAGLLALTVATGLAACGDDDDTTSDTTTTAAAGAGAAFCDAVIEFNTAVFQVDVHEESTTDEVVEVGEQLAPLSQAIVDNAPDEVADAAAGVDDFVQPMLDGDAEAFNADATFDTYTTFLGQASEACAFQEVAVSGVDYAFEGVPDTIEAGNVSFAFTNNSEAEEHEMGLIRKKDGVSLTFEEILNLPEDEGEQHSEFITITFAPPGGESSTLANLTPGDYAMVCFIPVGGQEGGKPHFAEGMIHEFTVE